MTNKEVVMKQNAHSCRKQAFTLIELLAVVVIISILAGITLMTGKYVYQRMNYKKARTDLTNIQHAIEAFYASYGHYPPVQTFGHQPQDMNPFDDHDLSDGKDYFVPVSQRVAAGPGLEGYIFSSVKSHKQAGASSTGFYFPPESYKWAHFLEDIQLGDYSHGLVTTNTPDKGETTYLPCGIVVVDPWMSLDQLTPGGGGLRYQYSSTSNDNYQSYTLWCKGADLNDPSDDFYLSSPATAVGHTYDVR